MAALIAIIPLLPLLGFLIMIFFDRWISKKGISWIAAGSVSLSALITLITGTLFMSSSTSDAVVSHVYNWMNAGGFTANVSFHLDALSLVFCFVITFVGALIHIYSIEFMKDDEGFTRFFAYMNLFVASMLILVLADNLLLLYLGWEGVGLCSYLLIGFWYKEPENGNAARKAFIVTRIGDTFMIIGLFLLFISFNTLDISSIQQQAHVKWTQGSPMATIAALLLLGGALGKSAQLPMQTWLPDAMAGPSPVSALIHAATMVTAGVYLIARTHVLFSLAPAVLTLVAIIGAITILVAGFSALTQNDLKRVLAYSTISQIGYMFLALGVGAWSAAIFHFMVHAFFKALLFLAAGSVILLLHEEHNMFKMGGLRKHLPVIFITFLVGGASLSALPLITAGFYSKDQILWYSWASGSGNAWLWAAGIAGAFITSLYTFRMIFLTFYGEMKITPLHQPGKLMTVPLIVLAILSIAGGFIELPHNFGNLHLFSNLTKNILPNVNIGHEGTPEWVFQAISALLSVAGVLLAYRLFYKFNAYLPFLRKTRISTFFYNGWGFDAFYDWIFVKPYVWLSNINRKDFIDKIYEWMAMITDNLGSIISITQNGRLRWYVMVLSAGIVVLLTIMMAL